MPSALKRSAGGASSPAASERSRYARRARSSRSQAARQQLGRPLELPGAHRELRGLAQLQDVVFVDQSPIGKSARSNPASYVGAWGAIRNLFARTALAAERGYTPGTFSFNAGDGRCPACTGSGFEHVEMQFLSDVYLRCPECDGKRFRPEVLEVRLDGGCSIAEVLAMTVSEALAHFAAHPEVTAMLAPLVDVGLDYLALGQPVPTLSGGEAQRLKLAGHLAEAGARPGTARRRSASTCPSRSPRSRRPARPAGSVRRCA